MSRAPGYHFAIGALCFAALCAATCAAADASRLEFDPPLSVSIRQTNGATARGKLLSVTEKELLLRAVNGKEVTFKLEKIRFVKTSNDTFEYWPNDETFAELCKRADKVPNATWNNPAAAAGRGARPARGSQPGETEDAQDRGDRRGDPPSRERAALAPSGNDILAPGRAGVTPGTTRQRAQVDDVEERRSTRRDPPPEEVPTESDTQTDSPVPGSTVYSCSSCMKDLPATFRSGDTCPHCGEIAVFEEDSAESAAKVDPKHNPFAPGGVPTVPAPVAPLTVAAPQPASGGLSISDVPLVAKIGIFIGLVALCWIIMQRR